MSYWQCIYMDSMNYCISNILFYDEEMAMKWCKDNGYDFIRLNYDTGFNILGKAK